MAAATWNLDSGELTGGPLNEGPDAIDISLIVVLVYLLYRIFFG